MTRLRTSVIGTALLLGAVAVLTWGVAAAPRPLSEREGLVVHEWGTFSTFSGSDGVHLKFHPNDRDLPTFVHSHLRYIKGGLPNVLVSLETPVLYFYTERELTASVQVDFPKGRMTEWYPEASRPPVKGLTWDGIKVFPRGTALPLRTAEKSRYYAARETDASPLEMPGEEGKKEQEKFLFYRGVGDFAMPLCVRALGGGTFKVKNTGSDPIPAFVLVRVEGGKVRFRTHGPLAAGVEASVREPSEDAGTAGLGETVAGLLIREGLHEKEARAMVKTWSADWFAEEGTRVLYLVPARLTNEFLPLRIRPKPDRLVRVLVGRHDVLTPEKEREIDALVKKLTGPSNAEARAADKGMQKLGRYRWAAQAAGQKRLMKNVRGARSDKK